MVEEVPGSKNGRHLLKELVRPDKTVELGTVLFWPKDFTHLSFQHTEDLMNLIKALREHGYVRDIKETNEIAISSGAARQYLQNDKTGDWILVDIE